MDAKEWYDNNRVIGDLLDKDSVVTLMRYYAAHKLEEYKENTMARIKDKPFGEIKQ